MRVSRSDATEGMGYDAWFPTTRSSAFACAFAGMLLNGSWPILTKVSGVKRWQVFFFFFNCGFVVAALGIGFALGGGLPPIKREWCSVYALAAGPVAAAGLCLGLASMEVLGLAVVAPTSTGVEIVVGTTLLYAIRPDAADPLALFGGVALAAAAVYCAARAAEALEADRSDAGAKPSDGVGLLFDGDVATPKRPRYSRVERRRGFAVGAATGLAMASWPVLYGSARACGVAIFEFIPAFALPFFLASVYAYLPLAALWPLQGKRVEPAELFEAGLLGGCAAAAAGVAWASAVSLVFLATPKLTITVSFAIARCYPLVTAAAGIAFFGEADGASHRTRAWLAGEFLCYGCGVGLICASKRVDWT